MRKRCLLSCLVGVTLCPLVHAAEREAEPSLTLAFFAPTAPLASGEARFAYVERLARQLQGVGISSQARAFARAADLESAIRRGQVDLGIIDAVYLAERGQAFPLLASTTVGGEATMRWGLYTSAPPSTAGQPRGVMGLAQARVAYATLGGRDLDFLDNVIFDGELRVSQHFTMRPPAPDVAAAVSDVVLRRADCVFAPEAAVAGKGLRRVFDAGRVPTPALVLLRPGLPRDLIAQAQRALLGTATLGVLDGFRAVNPDLYRQLRAQLRARPQRRLLMAEPQPLLTAVRSAFLVREDPTPQLPPLHTLLAAPTSVP